MDMDLIPGLPNEIGFECLLRAPMEDFFSVTLVCKSWNRVLKLPEFWSQQKAYLSQRHELFFFHPISPGSCLFLPRGARIYDKLAQFIENQYLNMRGYDYEKVMRPNTRLWYQTNYKINCISGIETRLESMNNCEFHCYIFGIRNHSYTELPIRMVDYGLVHQNETRSASLTGLKDDAHIFCRVIQIKNEVKGVLNFISFVYNIFGFTFELKLSTRPETYYGVERIWKMAETALAEALNEAGKPWEIREGNGAFYGPRIDIIVYDAMRREIQCGRLQLDFQLPTRFNLSFQPPAPWSNRAVDEIETKRVTPVMIHVAILGPVKRMFGKLFEQYKGKWPFWLSPRQAIVCTVSEKSQAYALQVRDSLCHAGFIVDVDSSDVKINKKVRKARLAQYNYILVVGESEVATRQVDVRVRDNNDARLQSVDELLNHFKEEADAFR